MIKKNIDIKIILINAFLFLSTLFSYAGNEVLTSRLQGSSITNTATLIVKDDKYSQLQSTPGLVNQNVINTITLGIDPSTSMFRNSTYSLSIDLDIKYIDENYVWQNVGLKTLTVDYDPTNGTSYLDKDVLVFSGGHYVKIEILSVYDLTGPISSAPNDIYLNSTIDIERYYQFSSQDIPAYTNIGHQLSHANSRELIVSWDNIEGAEEYDLEWTWVNNYDVINGGSLPESSVSYNFKNNATRVRLAETEYTIPLVYERGWILYRYRAIGKGGVDFDIPIEGVWSTEDVSVPDLGTIPAYPSINRYEVLPHDNDDLNWQYSSTFAENGKKSSAVSYYDGTLRNRQSVAKLNSEDKIIAGSVLYDYQGRPAINVLPAPIYKNPVIADPSDKQLSGYIENLNISDVTAVNFDKNDFDVDIDASCSSASNKMNAATSKGAAQYYSDQNPEKEGAQAFLPDAEGYPFVRTEYTNDQTGRVRRQGGLGETHQMETDHETKYFYGQPEQPELDVLFGNEAGLATHYKKNAVVDANGQVSISYIDMHDRVVATALSGQAPNDKVIPLASNVAPQSLVSPLMGFNHPAPDNKALIVSRDILVTAVGNQTFDYSITTESYNNCLPPSICFDCVYEVTISIKDECGNELIGRDENTIPITLGQPITEVVGNINPFDVNCDAAIVYTTTPSPITVSFPKVGTYSVYKELRVSQQPINYYIQQYIDSNTCDQSYEDLLAIELAGLDFSGCNITACDYECLLIYPNLQAYRDGENDQTLTQTQYDAWLVDCVSDCKNGITNRCDLIYKTLKLDFYPGGQYAEFGTDLITGDPIASSDPYSIFYSSTPTAPIKHYTDGSINWVDANSNPILVTNFNNIQVSPGTLSLEEFLFLFDPAWLYVLVPLHPEYCSYTFCTGNQAAYNFIEDFQKTTTFAQACAKGYLNPTGNVGVNTQLNIGCNNGTNIDPFLAAYPTALTTMNNYLNNTGYGSASAWTLAVATTNSCNGALPDPITCANTFFGTGAKVGDPACNNVEAWNAFKALYYKKWMELIDGVRFSTCSHPPGTKTENFPDFNTLPTTNPPLSNTPNDALTMGTTICEAQADAWMDDLAGCFNQLPPGESWLPGQTTYDNIRQGFIDVCVGGTVNQTVSPVVLYNYTGSTSSPTAVTIGANTVYNVNDVLVLYLGASYENNLCSPLLITGAQPHTSIFNGSYYMDNCGCDKILETDQEFNYLSGFGLLPTGVTTASELLTHNLSIFVSNFEQLVCECNASKTDWTLGSTWTTGEKNSILAKQLITDPALLCEVCIPCEDLEDAITAFNALPSNFDGPPPVANYDELLAVYLNNIFGVDFVAQDYLDFKTQCDLGIPTCTADVAILTKIEALLLYLRDQAILSGSYSFTVPVSDPPLFNYLAPLISNCDPAANTQALITITNIGGSYTINIASSLPSDCPFDCNYFFTLPPGKLFEDINLISLEGACDVGLSSFTGTVIDAGGTTYTIDGSTDCFNFCACENFLCYSPIITPEVPPGPDPCIAELIAQAQYNAQILYEQQTNASVAAFLAEYYEKCMLAQETFDMTFNAADHHYTLYYYDQAGNLTKTVPPKGVNKLISTTAVVAHRNNPLLPAVFVVHSLETEYTYNSYNQVKSQVTPDGGLTHYFYDNIGRLVVSQNAKQAGLGVPHKYSYTLYDEHGRIIEVGEAKTSLILDNTNAPETATWLADPLTTNRNQVTKTYYDEVLSASAAYEFENHTQENLRNRISSVTFQEIYTSNKYMYDNATHYSYDEHGNVLTSVQENNDLGTISHNFKRTDYTYELISGNITKVAYQQGKVDQFFHKYCYDADNRLIEVQTSRNNVLWDRDAKYKYYEHGPLARTETGDLQVQGTDYAYTIQGWLKGVNSNTLVEDRDMGKDGIKSNAVNPYMSVEPDQHALIARDAFGFSLDYFANDYNAISAPAASTNFLATITPLSPYEQRTRKNLYNGNITGMTNALLKPDGNKMDINGYAYQYDQLNRLKQMDVYTGGIGTNNDYSTAAITTDYFVSLDYDDNGNITNLLRNAYTLGAGGLSMDNMAYTYTPGTNRLDNVNDAVTGSFYNDIKTGQIAGNYEYTEIGELKKDVAEQIENIEWTVYGKVKKVTRTSTPAASKPSDLEFVYGPSGQRIIKIEKPRTPAGVLTTQEFWIYTYYVYDASGNLMATYDKTYEVRDVTSWNDLTVKLKLNEHPIYGSSRLGLANEDILLYDQDFSITGYNADNTFIELFGSHLVPTLAILDTTVASRTLGKKMYELTNHLGNVQVVVSDRKISTEVGSTGIIDYYTADVVSASDYYPGGSIMPGRSFNSNAYRYGWNKGSEKDDEITGVVGSHYTTYFREFDTRLNRTWSYDPSSVAWESPYAVNRNNPIVFVDPMGDWPKWLGGKGKGGFSSSKRRYKVGKRRDNSSAKVDKPKPIRRTYEQVFIAKGSREVSQSYLTGLDNSIGNLQEKFDATKNAYYQQRILEKQRLQASINDRLTHELNAITQPSDQEELGMSSVYKSRNLQLNYGVLHDGQFFNITFNNRSIFSFLGDGISYRGAFSRNNIKKGSGYTLSLTNTPAFETYRSAMGTGASSTFTLPDGTVVTSTISFTVLETLQYGISVFQKRRWGK